MNFIETFLHVSPDGGSGTLEAAYLVAAAAVVAAILFRRNLAALGRLAASAILSRR
ncbi:MAG: hypothetical protein WAN39_01365 [Candidatus Cybelea sp.]